MLAKANGSFSPTVPLNAQWHPTEWVWDFSIFSLERRIAPSAVQKARSRTGQGFVARIRPVDILMALWGEDLV